MQYLNRILQTLRALDERVIDRSPVELVFMRALFAFVVWDSILWHQIPDEMRRPHGLGNIMDLTALADPAVLLCAQICTALGLLSYVSGVVPAVGLTLVSLAAVGVGTLLNSQGAIGHSSQLVTLMVLGQCALYWGRSGRLIPSWRTHTLAVHAANVVIAAGYTVCGFIKLWNTNGLWIYKAPALAVQLLKARSMEFYNYLAVKDTGFWHSMPEWIIANPNLARLFFGAGLLLEFACFLALAGRGWALFFGLGLIGMHYSISLIMSLDFKWHIYVLLIFFVNAPGWCMVWKERRG